MNNTAVNVVSTLERTSNYLPSISLAKTPVGKALQLIEQGKLKRISTGFLAIGSRGLTWEVKVEGSNVKCECEGFQFTGNCYHAKAAELIVKGMVN